MDKETAYNVVACCIEALLENKQQGQLQVVTGGVSGSLAADVIIYPVGEYGLLQAWLLFAMATHASACVSASDCCILDLSRPSLRFLKWCL